MKRCPTCKRTFEDTLTYCLIDGSILDAPFDPSATLTIPEPRQTAPPPTEVMWPQDGKEIPPTVASPRPQQKPLIAAPTIASPAPVLEWQPSPVPVQPARKPSRLALIIMGVGALLVIGLIFFIIANRTNSMTDRNNETNPSPSPTINVLMSKFVGTWKSVEESPYRLVIRDDGTYMITSQTDDKSMRGTYTVSGDTATLSDPEGKGDDGIATIESDGRLKIHGTKSSGSSYFVKE